MTDHVEMRIVRSYWDDGLLDLLVGVGLLIAGAAWMNGAIALAAVAAPLLVAVWRPLRRRIVEPRAGFVRFTLARRNRTRSNLTATLVTGVGALIFVAGMSFVATRAASLSAGTSMSGLPGGLVALGIAIAGLLTGARRFYFYAACVLAITAGFSAIADRPDAPLLAGGLLIAVSGAALLTRFIRGSADMPGDSE